MRKLFVIDFDDWADAGWVDAEKDAERQIKKELGRGAFVQVNSEGMDPVVEIDYAIIDDPEELRDAVANGLGIHTQAVYDMRDEGKYTADNAYGYFSVVFRDKSGRTTVIATSEHVKVKQGDAVVDMLNRALRNGSPEGVIPNGKFELRLK